MFSLKTCIAIMTLLYEVEKRGSLTPSLKLGLSGLNGLKSWIVVYL